MQAASRHPTAASADLQETLVLIVDAVAADADDLSRILSDGGYVAQVAQNGPDALAAIHEARPQLMVVATDLSGITGRELHAALAIDKHTSGIPVVMIRARGASGQASGSRDGPVPDLICKPFEADEVLARVATQLEFAGLRARHTEQTRILTVAMQRLTDAIRKDGEQSRQLRASKGRIKTLIDNLPGLAYRCRYDADWTMEFLSDAAPV